MRVSAARCHLLARVLAADGIITGSERTLLEETMQAMGLSEDERDKVVHFEGNDAAEVIRELSEPERREILEGLANAALADGNLSPHEVAEVKKISREIGLGTGMWTLPG